MTTFTHPTACLAALLLIAAAAPACADCDHRADRDATAELGGVTVVEISARAGDLLVEAGTGTELRARGQACASTSGLLDQIELRTDRSGSTLRLEVVTPKTTGWNKQARLDLRVELPADLAVRIDDSSGDLTARGITLERLKDGSGDIRLQDTRGSVSLGDGSGDIVVRDHRGDLEIEDGSGDVRLRGIDGRVLIADDGSGDLDMERVTGDVEVRNDGSGDIVATTVGGNLSVRSAGSGDVRYRDIAGDVDVPRRR